MELHGGYEIFTFSVDAVSTSVIYSQRRALEEPLSALYNLHWLPIRKGSSGTSGLFRGLVGLWFSWRRPLLAKECVVH